ncbi:MAG: signal recognition particle-docking protein FtsY [Armatimonadetes bacterium]|nr:signal recognition particle-docking protein FtsY [Candidatus Hippobium faecium]
MRFFKNLFNKVSDILTGRKPIDEELFDEIEEALIEADLSIRTVEPLMENLRDEARRQKLTMSGELENLLADMLSEELTKNVDIKLKDPKETPTVYMFVGVNGVGKTTSIAKVAHYFKSKGKKVIIAAADTFRAAAIEQLEIWAERVGADIVKHQHGSDPASVVYDAIESAKAKKANVVLIDTAGRLHNKAGLMEELAKIGRSTEKILGRPADEVLLVLDATTGQNAISQAQIFKENVPITGIVLTKMDGTAKGGVVITVKNDLQIPIKLITTGEGKEQLKEFNSKEFSKSLFDLKEKEKEETTEE